MCNTFFLLQRLIYRVPFQKDFEKTPSQRTSKDNSGNITNTLLASMFLSLLKKTALQFFFAVLSYVQGALQKRV